MNRKLACLVVASELLLAAGCTGSGTPALTPSLPNSTPIASRAADDTGNARVRVAIRIPRTHRHRRDRFVSPATRSMKLAIAHGKKKVFSETVNLTPDSKGCTATLAGTVCTAEFGIAVGNGYMASMTTYDGLKGAGSVLSIGQVAFDVKKGQLNTVMLTLNGVPKSIRVKQIGSDSISVTALDADGNFIVGPGAPAFTAAKTSGATVAAITQPTSTAPNTIGVAVAAPPPVAPSTETIGVTASYKAGTGNACAQAGAVCSLSAAMVASYEVSGTFFVGDYNGFLKGFTTPLSGSGQAPAYALTVPSAYATGVDANGDVFSADYGGTVLYSFKPPYTAAPATSTGIVGSSIAVAVNSTSHVFVGGGSTVSEVAPPYNGAPTSITSGTSGVYGLALDAADNLYVANYTSSVLGVYAASDYTTQKYAVTLASHPYSATRIGSKLYVGEATDLEIFSLPITSSAATPVVTISNGIGEAYGAALDASGDLFVSNYGSGDVAEYPAPLSSGEAPTVTMHTGLSGPCGGLTFDANGFLYVIDYTAGLIAEFNPPFTNSSSPAATTSGMSDPCYGGLAIGSSPTFKLSVP